MDNNNVTIFTIVIVVLVVLYFLTRRVDNFSTIVQEERTNGKNQIVQEMGTKYTIWDGCKDKKCIIDQRLSGDGSFSFESTEPVAFPYGFKFSGTCA